MPKVRSATRRSPCRKWCFTLNNPQEEDYPVFNEATMKYLVFQLEEGEEGTPHLQGFIWLVTKARLGTMKKLLPRAHWERAKGTAKQNRHYCMKPVEGCTCKHCVGATQLDEPLEFGSMPSVDTKGLMETLVKLAKDGLTFLAACEEEPRIVNHGRAWKGYVEALRKKQGNEWRSVEVEVLVGEPGTGKTRAAVAENGGYANVYILTKMNKGATWFDGLEGEGVILIDDFDSEWSVPYRALLRLLDGHPLRLPVKQAHTYALFTKVVITTNEPVARWYPHRREIDALERRITRTRTFPERGISSFIVRGTRGGEEGGSLVVPGIQVGGNTAPPSAADPHFSHRSSTGGVPSTPLPPLSVDVITIDDSSSDTPEAAVPLLVRGNARVVAGHRRGGRGMECSFLDLESACGGAGSGDESDGSVGSLADFVVEFTDSDVE